MSEAYIDVLLKGEDQICDVNIHATGGYIAGKVKLTVTLVLLAGGDALKSVIIFDITSDKYNSMMYKELLNWIIKTYVGCIIMMKQVGNKETMVK